jgi:phosphohistidine phosphatase
MNRLYLLRHAKSSWELAGELDYERGLTERGAEDCALIAEWIRSQEIAPELVLCSGARRARETLEGVAAALPKDAQVIYDDSIYQAPAASTLAELVRDAARSRSAVMLVGHNPSIHDFAVDIASGGDELESLAVKFPTAALAEFELAADWDSLGSDSAELTAFIAPKHLRAPA